MPGGAFLGILEHNALCGKFAADLICTGIVLILLCFNALGYHSLDILSQLVAVLFFLRNESKAQNLVQTLDDGKLCVSADILLERIIQYGQAKRGIEIVADILNKACTVSVDNTFVDLALRFNG